MPAKIFFTNNLPKRFLPVSVSGRSILQCPLFTLQPAAIVERIVFSPHTTYAYIPFTLFVLYAETQGTLLCQATDWHSRNGRLILQTVSPHHGVCLAPIPGGSSKAMQDGALPTFRSYVPDGILAASNCHSGLRKVAPVKMSSSAHPLKVSESYTMMHRTPMSIGMLDLRIIFACVSTCAEVLSGLQCSSKRILIISILCSTLKY